MDIRANGTGADAFTGNLQLVLEASLLSTSSAVFSPVARDQILASTSAGQQNLLALHGDMVVNTVAAGSTVADDTTVISGFQTIQFGTNALAGVMSVASGLGLNQDLGAEGYFDAGGMAAGTVYDIVRTSGELVLDDLSGPVSIFAPGITGDIELYSKTTGATLDVSLLGQPAGNWSDGDQNLEIYGFGTINLDVAASGAAPGYDWDFDLVLGGDARNLVVTGGSSDDSLEFDDDFGLPPTLEVIDVSGYAGSFTAELDNDQDPGSDVTFVVGGNDFTITLTALGGAADADAQFNSIFRFMEDAELLDDNGTADPTDDVHGIWTIDNFVFGGYTDANINNWSKLDLSIIGVTEDVGVNAVVGDWDGDSVDDGLIVTADGFDFEIRLVDETDPARLTVDNIIFA